MKKLLSLCLAFCLMAGATPALAATQDKQLEAVTEKVKGQLDIGAQYTEFYGELDSDALSSHWSLHWTAPGEQISVSALDDGTITWYHHSIDQSTQYDTYAPALPKNSRTQAEKSAQDFLSKVLRPRETAVLESSQPSMLARYDYSYRFYGTLYYDGLPTPTTFSVQVRPDSLSVYSFDRNESRRMGDIPSKTPAVTAEKAQQLLKDTIKLRLQYTTEQSEDRKAVLRYVPVSTDEFIVDAQTGDLINLTELAQNLEKYLNYSDEAAKAMDAGAGGGLSRAEQAGIELLKDVLGRDALNAKLTAMSELGLSGFSLGSVNYSINRATGEVSAYLDYAKDKENRCYATVNAKTGDLHSFYRYYQKEMQAVASKDNEGRAQTFLKKYAADPFAKCILLEETEGVYRYVQQENGYPFPENNLRIAFTSDGTLYSYQRVWDEAVTFSQPGQLISADAALDAYFKEFHTTLGYQSVPVAIDLHDPRYADYISSGYRYLYEWKLGYAATLDNYCYGLDAHTGEVLFASPDSVQPMQYTDISPQTHPQISTLAEYGVGFSGGTFEPGKTLTQADLVELLMSADGYQYDPSTEGSLEKLYDAAYANGLLTRAEYAPQQTISRALLVKILVRGTGYGKTAELPGIYRTVFTDDADIPSEYYGYVAIAQGMGLIHGDEHGRFLPNELATREQAALVLYSFMSR